MKPIPTLAILSLSFVTAHAWQKYEVDVTQERFPAHSEPDHLLPVASAVPESYYLAQFTALPSFADSTTIVVSSRDEKYFIDLSPGKAGEKVRSREIRKEDAVLIYSIWTNALLETRYSRNSSAGLDGATYIFSTYIRGTGWLHGKTWSPQIEAPPRWLLETASYLYSFTTSQEKDSSELTRQLTDTHEKLIKYLDKNGA